jgi:BMFP domain-containing protein YqiC
MPTTSSRFFDEMAKLMSNAAGAAQGVRREIDTLVKAQVERVLNDIGVVKREELDVVRDMAQKAREENDRLAGRVAELERKLSSGVPPGPGSVSEPISDSPPF